MNSLMYGVTFEDLNILVGEKFRFPVYPDAAYMNSDVTDLDLSQRATNALKRSKIKTISALVGTVDSEDDLRKFRNLGAKTAKEIG